MIICILAYITGNLRYESNQSCKASTQTQLNSVLLMLNVEIDAVPGFRFRLVAHIYQGN